jgi:caffeoyl-CoA O-methyltransferase
MERTDRDIEAYSREVFGAQDAHLAGLMEEAVAAGLPDIAVSAEIGRLLLILTALSRGRLALELGTLGGYSAIWIARGLAPGGRLITVEREARHAEFAKRQFRRAGVEPLVEIRLGDALEVLATLVKELEPGSVDLLFIDAAKEEYPAYFERARSLVAVGGVVAADNIYGSGTWEIGEVGHPMREAMDRFNRMVADDPDFEAVGVPFRRQGVLIARRMK